MKEVRHEYGNAIDLKGKATLSQSVNTRIMAEGGTLK